MIVQALVEIDTGVTGEPPERLFAGAEVSII